MVEPEWKPISSAPKNIVSRDRTPFGNLVHEYGPRILVYPHSEEVGIARWWQTEGSASRDNGPEYGSFQSVYGHERPTHWMLLPAAPLTSAEGD